jgi:hypothetical protein
MYKIIATDQKEYGPVTADQIRQWITEGRLNAQSAAMAEGETEWKPLAAFPEFAGALPGATAAAGAPPPAPPGALRPIPKTSGMAIASLVLGILGLFSCGMVQVRKMGSEKSGLLSTTAAQDWDHGATGSAMGSTKDCQSAISRLSLASRFAEWHAAVNSWRRISARRSRATVLERRRAGVVEKNLFASGSGMSNITCISEL